MPIVAEVLNLSRAEVHGVVTFYHFFRTQAARQADALRVPRRGLPVDGLARARAARAHRSSASISMRRRPMAVYSLEPVYCLGNCACSPAVMVDETVYGRVTPAAARRDPRVEAWPTTSRSSFLPIPRRARSARTQSRAPSRPRPTRAALSVEIVRNGSRGLYWLEPLVEVVVGDVRHRLRAGDGARRPRPLRSGFSHGRASTRLPSVHRRAFEYLQKQTRLTFARVGIIDPTSLDDYRRPRRLSWSRECPRAQRRANRRGRHGLRPARPRRRGIPDRHQMEDGARRSGRPEVRRLQRRRRRFGHVRGPHDHRERSVRARSKA